MKIIKVFCVALTVAISSHISAISIVRDAEIEETLTDMAKSLFKVANLDPKTAKVYVIDSKEINAFTIGNGYIFVNSGLVLKFNNPLEFLGILAHETGHISAGHISRHIHVLEQRSKNCVIAALAGIAGAALTGAPEAMAIMLGYVMADDRMYLRFSRGEELAADALGASYMEKLGYNANPMVDVFDAFQRIDVINGGDNIPNFIRTHPKPADRIVALRSKYKMGDTKAPPELLQKYRRVQGKLKAFLNNENNIGASDDDYLRAVQYHRKGQYKQSIDVLRRLIRENPKDVYYKETLAQVLYENGQLNESIRIYEQIYHKNINVLIKIDYAKVLLETSQKIEFAIQMLESIKYREYLESDIFRLLAKAYGKLGRNGVADVMLAQEQILLQNYSTALAALKRALSTLNKRTESSYIKKAEYLKSLIERDYLP